MKKKTLRSLKLNKKSISIIENQNLKGGIDRPTIKTPCYHITNNPTC